MAQRAKTKTTPPKRVNGKVPNLLPTTAELEAMRAHKKLTLELGHEPTPAQVSDAINGSRTLANRHFTMLERKGAMVRKTVKRTRVIEDEVWQLTETGETWLTKLQG